ncbi:MAG: GNAT family N-acetyltransferase [Candidatus Competibacteraceae bacterium]|nr:GNAT family N-acetyltransferase [Candidatus Competibacteraceae bacterium]NJO54200.1 GNAT family N-acetyltransferase [Bacteroidales bacterium]
MRAIAIEPEAYDNFAGLLDAMHRLRARVFQDRLNWDVTVTDGREADSFDSCNPTYILALSEQNRVVGCARLLPATGPTLLDVLFPELRRSGLIRPHTGMIESSRFCVDTKPETEGAGRRLHDATWTLFAALIEWSMSQGYREIVTATDVRIERILRRAGWPMTRIGEPRPIGNTLAVAGLLSVDQLSFDRVRPANYSSSIRALARAA